MGAEILVTGGASLLLAIPPCVKVGEKRERLLSCFRESEKSSFKTPVFNGLIKEQNVWVKR